MVEGSRSSCQLRQDDLLDIAMHSATHPSQQSALTSTHFFGVPPEHRSKKVQSSIRVAFHALPTPYVAPARSNVELRSLTIQTAYRPFWQPLFLAQYGDPYASRQ